MVREHPSFDIARCTGYDGTGICDAQDDDSVEIGATSRLLEHEPTAGAVTNGRLRWSIRPSFVLSASSVSCWPLVSSFGGSALYWVRARVGAKSCSSLSASSEARSSRSASQVSRPDDALCLPGPQLVRRVHSFLTGPGLSSF